MSGTRPSDGWGARAAGPRRQRGGGSEHPGAKSKQPPARTLLECLRHREADVLRFKHGIVVFTAIRDALAGNPGIPPIPASS